MLSKPVSSWVACGHYALWTEATEHHRFQVGIDDYVDRLRIYRVSKSAMVIEFDAVKEAPSSQYFGVYAWDFRQLLACLMLCLRCR